MPPSERRGSSGCWMIRRVEGADVAERPAHDLGVGHRLQPVGEGERPALGQQAHLHEIAAFQPLGHRGIAIDLGQARLPGAPRDEFDRGDIVDDRVGVGEAHHAGDSARGRGTGTAGDGLHMLLAGLAQLHAHVHEPRRQAMARALHHLGLVRQAFAIDPGADLDDAPVDGEEAARLVAAGRRIDQPGIHQDQRAPNARHRRSHCCGACGSADPGRPCARPRPSPPARGSGCGRYRRRPRNRSRPRGSSARDA